MPNLPTWLTPVLRWGGLALAVLMAAILIVVKFLTKAPEAGAMPELSAAPEWLYWVLVVVGVIAAAVGFSVAQRKT
jgi:mannose/fructose/N-acetylgalactosamine-specific phosphotransferase system component IIC